MQISIRRAVSMLLASSAVSLAACGGDEPPTAEAVETYADGVYASYSASLATATAMDAAIDAFVAAPADETLAAAKQTWLDARDDYGVTEAFRFYGGPIDDEENGPEGLINAWPMDEAYLDSVEGDAGAGIVNDPATYPTIDAELLMSLNEAGGETNIATGWHAIEFLLWGQDLDEDGPGARPVADYVDAPNAGRRAAYLATASDLLLTHLQGLRVAGVRWLLLGDDSTPGLAPLLSEATVERLTTEIDAGVPFDYERTIATNVVGELGITVNFSDADGDG